MIISKYCASGNDFLIFHTFNNVTNFDARKLAIKLCNRYYGIGADGLVILRPSDDENIAYQWDFYNSDGSIANMCGNASRAVGLYAFLNKLAYSKHNFLTRAGVISAEVLEIKDKKSAIVKSKLGAFKNQGRIIEKKDGKDYDFKLIQMTIPHLVYIATSLQEMNILTRDMTFLSLLRNKYDCNVNIAFKDDNEKIHYATFERGIEGITQACGTGACATYVAFNNLNNESILIPPSKEELIVECKDNEIYFRALTHFVFDVSIDL